MENEDIQNLLKTGIEAAQSGNKIIARHILEQVVNKDPKNEMGWLWLASVVDTVDERRDCLQKVLSLNPNNERARQALSRIPRSAPPTDEAAPEGAASGARLGRAPGTSRTATTAPPLRPPLVGPRETRRRRGVRPTTFAVLAILAVGMIAAGIFLLYNSGQDEEDQTPTAVPAAAIEPTRPILAFTPTPGPSPTPRPAETLGPTWTPSNTPTPTDTPLPTATPLPLDTYSLLAAARREGQTNWALYVMRADGANEQQVLLSLDAAVTVLDVYDATYSPDGTLIAFSVRVSDGSAETEDLYVAPVEGGDMRRVTALAAPHVEGATWSSDGQQIAFASDSDGDYDIYVVSADGGTPRSLTDNTVVDRYPAWSPDGLWIAFASDNTQPGTLEVWRMNPEGTDLKQLTDNQNSSFAPAWSPDGESIAFVSDRRLNVDLYLMTANGDGERALLPVRDVAADELDPAWSEDGKWIAFSSDREGGVFDLYAIRPDGSELQRITSQAGDTRYVVWRP